MSLIKETRPRRKVYNIRLNSQDTSAFTSLNGSVWKANWSLNLNEIMYPEELNRPYYLSFTFLSSTGAANTPPAADSIPLYVYANFNGGSKFPNDYINSGSVGSLPSGQTPLGVIPYFCDGHANAPAWGLKAGTTDNNPVYIQSLQGVNFLTICIFDMTGNDVTDPILSTRWTMNLHLVPADF